MDAGKLRRYVSEELEAFLQPFLSELAPANRRLMAGLVRSLVQSGRPYLSETARLSSKTPAALHHHHLRLCQRLANRRWDHSPVQSALLAYHAARVGPHDWIPIDLTEWAKPYARKMQYLDRIRDASDPDKRTLPGYWCFQSYRYHSPDNFVPLQLIPYSTQQPHFDSQNQVICRHYRPLHRALGPNGVYIEDRGFDAKSLLSDLLGLHRPFIVRQRGDRHLVGPDGRRRSVRDWIFWCRQQGQSWLWARSWVCPLQFPWHPARLYLVVPADLSDDREPWMLLTYKLIGHQVGPLQIRSGFARRWSAEDAIRFIKQMFHLELFLVRSLLAQTRLLLAVNLAFAFLNELLQSHERPVKVLLDWRVPFPKPTPIKIYALTRAVQQLCQGAAASGIQG